MMLMASWASGGVEGPVRFADGGPALGVGEFADDGRGGAEPAGEVRLGDGGVYGVATAAAGGLVCPACPGCSNEGHRLQDAQEAHYSLLCSR